MQTLAQIKELLDARGLRPKRSLGQNFLIDHNLIRKVVDSAGVGERDLVLEVGPGTGTMTEELLARGATVVACELDDALAALNRERLPALPGVRPGQLTLVHGDCLESKHEVSGAVAAALAGRPFKLVANLPYGAATPLLLALLVDFPQCSIMSVTIQREVAERLLAHPGSKDFGPLAVVAQTLATVSRIATAPPACFWPRPEVTSSIVLITRRAEPLTSEPRALSNFARALFAHRRKQLGSALRDHVGSSGKTIDWAGAALAPGCDRIVPTLRAEQLSVPEIIALERALHSQGFAFVGPEEIDTA